MLHVPAFQPRGSHRVPDTAFHHRCDLFKFLQNRHFRHATCSIISGIEQLKVTSTLYQGTINAKREPYKWPNTYRYHKRKETINLPLFTVDTQEKHMSSSLTNRWVRFQKLKWNTPSYIAPHGYAGVCSLICGCYLLYTGPFRSTLEPFGTSLPYQYVFFTILNAIGGYQIANKAPKLTRVVFKACAIFQSITCYYVMRFLPTFYPRVPYILLRCMDCIMVVPFLVVGASFMYAAYLIRKEAPASAIAIVFGTLALTTIVVFPMHLVHNGQWLNCLLQQRYPSQDIALTAYTYLPVTLFFSLMLFGATLQQRRIISDAALGMMAIFGMAGVLFVSTLMQEIQLSGNSGLNIYLPCPEPEPGTRSYSIEKAIDLRESFQYVLSFTFVQKLIYLLGIVPISDHSSYRPVTMKVEL